MATFKTLPTRPLGKNGPLVPRLGLGLMSSSGMYGASYTEEERLHFLDEAFNRGERFWDTGKSRSKHREAETRLTSNQADKYGDSEDLLGKWFAKNPEKRGDVFLATKFGIQMTSSTPPAVTMNSTPEYCRAAIEKSLQRLGLPSVDLYYVHRLDKVTPIERTMEAMVELKKAGKIKYIGLSACSAESLRRAHAVHPVTCIQVEYSLFCTEIESPQRMLLEVARELGVATVGYSPLGNGILTGTIRSRDDVSKPGDLRGHLPWLHDVNIREKVAIVDQIADIARAKGVSTPQLALAWVLAQGDDIFPIPGVSRVQRLEENLESLFVEVSEEEENKLRVLGKGISGAGFQGETGWTFADTPALD